MTSENTFKENSWAIFREGMHDGMPICFGYFVVAFTLGIIAKTAGITPLQGFVASALNMASAGEYIGFSLIAVQASFVEIAIMTLVANARYILMSFVMSQHFPQNTPLYQRVLVGAVMTDELFGIAVAKGSKYVPMYSYGAIAVSIPGWAIGTSLGIIAGNTLPPGLVSALSVALYGMFIAIIIPPAKEDRSIRFFVVISFIASFLAYYFNFYKLLSEGTCMIILSVGISAIAAYLHPGKNVDVDVAAAAEEGEGGK